MTEDRTFNEHVNVLRRPQPPHFCTLPKWRERHRMRIVLGDRVQCRTCRQVWIWKDVGWEDTDKRWEKEGEPADEFFAS